MSTEMRCVCRIMVLMWSWWCCRYGNWTGVTQSTFHWWRDKSDSTTEHDEAGKLCPLV